jgi:uncharacterized GH25 family protein
MLNRLWIAILIFAVSAAFAAERVTLTGTVTDSLGKPLEDATVMVYHAGVKTGYSAFCPSCYVDCGKRTVTDRTGSFTIKSLAPDLWFELLVVRDGYTPTFVKKVDPSKGPAGTAALARRAVVDDPDRVVRGRVVDTGGQPVRAAVVEPLGIYAAPEDSLWFGTIEGLEPVAVTNPKGEFELAYSKKATGMVLRVEARTMATKVVAVPTGAERKSIAVSEGAVVRGRLMNHGKPVAGAELGLIPRNTGGFSSKFKISGDPYEEIRIGTQDDGSFVITNVPAPVNWYGYGKMESIGGLGATDHMKCATVRDGEEVDVGDIEIHPGHRLRGKVTLSDGAVIADGMRVTVTSEGGTGDSQTVLIGRDGHFEFVSLPTGDYQIFASVRGYESGANQDASTTVDRDVDGFIIKLDRVVRR